MPPTTLAAGFGAGRALFGVALFAAPGRIARAWVGSDDAPAAVLARAVGGRDIALGAGAAAVCARGGDPRPWLAAGVLADTGDIVAAAAAGDRIPRNGRLGTFALAAGGALFGLWLLRQVD